MLASHESHKFKQVKNNKLILLEYSAPTGVHIEDGNKFLLIWKSN